MATTDCPIAYDHTDDLDECAVCGWPGARPASSDAGRAAGEAAVAWIHALNAISCCRPPAAPDTTTECT